MRSICIICTFNTLLLLNYVELIEIIIVRWYSCIVISVVILKSLKYNII